MARWLLVVAALGVLLANAALANVENPAGEWVQPGALFEQQLVENRRDSAEGIERQRQLAGWKAACVALALGIAIWGAAGSPPSSRARRLRRVALATLALVAIGSFYRFSFSERSREGMQIKDVYHYYVGAKYFAEMGYGRLYECTLAVAVQQEMWWVGQLDSVRDLRTMSPRPASEIRARSHECRERFSDERWKELSDDLAFFFTFLDGPRWRWLLLDHGYNPSPVWTLLAAPLANSAPAGGLPVLVQLDTLLVLAALFAIGWAFGFDAACLAAIVWGTGFLWRYTWVGDAFLRQIFFASAVIGVCLLKRGRPLAGGVLLAVSAWVRLFPAIFVAGYGLHALDRWRRERIWPPGCWRFGVGVVCASVVLVGASLVWTGNGVRDFQQFADNTAVYRDIAAVNMAGWPALLWRIDGTADLQWSQALVASDGFRISAGTAAWLRWVVTAAFALAYAAALRRLESWEAAAAAFVLIPVLAAPAGYYFHFCVLAVPLAARRPWIAVWLLLACLAWLGNGIFWRPLQEQFVVASGVALALSAAVLASLWWESPRESSA